MQFNDSYGTTVDLPALTIELNKKLSSVTTSNDYSGFKSRYEFLCDILEPEYLYMRLGADNLNEIDVMELSKLFSEVQSAYTLPILEDSMKPALKLLEDALPMIEKMERIYANGGGKQTRQGFSRVK